jgi:hypothetical protein
MMEEKKEKKGKKVVLAEPSEGEAYSPRPSRKPDISRRARLEGWHEEGVYLVSSVVQRPELKRERIIDQKNFKVSKTPGEKSSSLCLNMSVDSEAADPYGQMIEKVVRELGPKAHKPVKFQASGLVFQDGERLRVYHSKKAQEIKCVICLDASQSKYKVFAEVSDLMSKIYKTIESIK